MHEGNGAWRPDAPRPAGVRTDADREAPVSSAAPTAVRPPSSSRISAAPPKPAVHPFLQLYNLAAVIALGLMLAQLRGGTPGEMAALLAIPIVGLATFAADRRYLPTILLLCMPSAGVLGGREAAGLFPTPTQPFVFPDAATFVQLAGVEVTAVLVVLAAGFGRVAVEILRGGRAFRGVIPRWLLVGFLLAMLPVLAGGLLGQSLGYNRWSQGPRAMLAIAGFLWGVLLVRRAGPGAGRVLGRQLATMMVIAAVLMVVRFLSGMLVFVVAGMIGGVMPYFLSRRRIVEAAVCLLAVLVAALAMTLTTAAQVLLALGCVALAAPRFRAVGRWLVRVGVLAACVLSLLLIWVVMQLRGKTLVEVATRDEGLFAYAMFKLMGDRGPLWLAAVEQIAGGPYLVVPAGRPLRPQGFDYGGLVYTWEFGAHNAVLELVRNVGLIGGAAALAVIGFAIAAAVRLLLQTEDGALRGIAAGFLGVSILGLTTGNYPVYDVGFFLWAVAGMLAAVQRYAPARGGTIEEGAGG
jgi:hypothetical protein